MPEETTDKKVGFSDFSAVLGGVSLPSERSGATGGAVQDDKEGEVKKEEVAKLPEGESLPELKEAPDEEEDEPREPLPTIEPTEEVEEDKTVAGSTVKVKTSRDYTGIEDAHKPLFEKMGNESFDLAKKQYLEVKQLRAENETIKKAPKPTSVVGHERAYLLEPKYQDLVGNVQGAEVVQKHWQIQLARIRRGEKWQDLDVDAKTGRFVTSELKDSTAEDEGNVITWLEQAAEQKRKVTSEYQEFVGGYEKSFKGDLDALNNGIRQFFPDAEKPEMKKMEQEVINKYIPLSFRDHPVSRLWAHTVYEIAKRDKRIEELEKNGKKTTAIAKQAKDAPPTKKAMGAGVSNGTSGGVSFEDFQKVLSQR